jgi:hypothetical protein
MSMICQRTALILTTLLVCIVNPAHADALQDRLEAAIEAFGGIIPHAPDVGLGWADMVIRGAVDTANPSAVVQTDKIGDWLLANQPAGIDPQLKQRAEWVASTFKTVMGVNTRFSTVHPAQSIGVAELESRMLAAHNKVTPGPSREEAEAIQAAQAEEMKKEMAALLEEKRLRDVFGTANR